MFSFFKKVMCVYFFSAFVPIQMDVKAALEGNYFF